MCGVCIEAAMSAPAPAPEATALIGQRLGDWIAGSVGAPCSLRLNRRFTGGFSWTTYGATLARQGAAPREVIVRMGEPHGLLAPYETGPEAQVLRALAASAVPVPAVLFASDDLSIIGAPFMLQDKVAGVVPSPWHKGADLGNLEKEAAGEAPIAHQFVDALAALHGFAWQDAALPALQAAATPDDAAPRQLARWQGMLQASELARLPLLHHAIAWLRGNAPRAARIALVHGDYRVGNFLVHGGRISAILDWELVHLGDPMEDFGWACLRMFQDRERRICGLMEREALYARYEASAGHAVDGAAVRYYEALALFKVIAMNLNGARRVERGSSPDLRMATLAFGLPRLMRDLLDVMERAA